jgi:hypothetical protein
MQELMQRVGMDLRKPHKHPGIIAVMLGDEISFRIAGH